MKKKNILLFSLAVLLAFAFSSQNNLFSLVVPSAFADNDDDDDQVKLCHFAPGGGVEPMTLIVGTPALVNAHLAHGDTPGECFFCPPGIDPCEDSDGNSGIVPSQPDSSGSQRDIYGK